MEQVGEEEIVAGIAKRVFLRAWDGAFETFRLNFSFFSSGAFNNQASFVDALKGMLRTQTGGNDCVGDARKVRQILEEEKTQLKAKTFVRSVFFYRTDSDTPFHEAVLWTVTPEMSILFELFNEAPIFFRKEYAESSKRVANGLKRYTYELSEKVPHVQSFKGTRKSDDGEIVSFDSDPRESLLRISYRNVATNPSRVYICRWLEDNDRSMSDIVVWKVSPAEKPNLTVLKGRPHAPSAEEIYDWEHLFAVMPEYWKELQKWFMAFLNEVDRKNKN